MAPYGQIDAVSDQVGIVVWRLKVQPYVRFFAVIVHHSGGTPGDANSDITE